MARAREQLAATGGLEKRKAERVRATPAARRLARERGVQLADVSAAGGGRLVSEDDVRAFSSGQTDLADRNEEGGE